MKLNPQDLKKIALLTLEHYNQHAEEFWKGTRYHNVSQNIEALLQHIKGKPPFTILDFGCGPGRDLKAFVEQGHNVIGLDGAEHFVTMARAYSGREVWRQDFLKLALPEKQFDGVFANAALSWNTFGSNFSCMVSSYSTDAAAGCCAESNKAKGLGARITLQNFR